jgi:hypothetical protein
MGTAAPLDVAATHLQREDAMTDEMTDEEFSRRQEENSRWHYFDATVRVKALNEKDARQVLADSVIDYDDGDDPGSWGPLVSVGSLRRVE